MSILIDRGEIITALCAYLRTNVTELKLVKPYHGELDRYSKKVQLNSEMFPAEVALTTPFALVISKTRERLEKQGSSLKFKHELSVYIGAANNHDFNSLDVPEIFSIMDKCVNVLHGKQLIAGAGNLTIVNDGEFLLTTDLFTVYDQKYFQFEIGT